MKLTLQVLGIILMISVLGIVNVSKPSLNAWKKHDCFEQGGRYIENTSDSTMSACILGK